MSTALTDIPSSAATTSAGSSSQRTRRKARQVAGVKSCSTRRSRALTTCLLCSWSHQRLRSLAGSSSCSRRPAVSSRIGPVAGAAELAEDVHGDAAQPRAEGAGPAVVDKLGQLADHHFEDALGQVVHVGRLKGCRAQPGAHQRRVHQHQFLPGLCVPGVAQPFEQAGRGAGRTRGHGEPSLEWTAAIIPLAGRECNPLLPKKGALSWVKAKGRRLAAVEYRGKK